MTIETYMGVMWFVVAACSVIGIIGIVYNKKTGGRKPLAQHREIEYKKFAVHIHVYGVYRYHDDECICLLDTAGGNKYSVGCGAICRGCLHDCRIPRFYA